MSKRSLTILSDQNVPESLCCELVEPPDLSGFIPAPEELSVLSAKASPARRTQFILGRFAAHRGLEKLGAAKNCIISKGDKGEPIWPAGFVGSISHTTGAGLAVVGRATEFMSLGADLERVERKFDTKLLAKTALPAESKWVKEDKEESNIRGLSLFSAKESVYKALYPITRRYIGFKDVFLRWDDAAQGFIATLLTDLDDQHHAGDLILVQCVVQEPYLMTCAIIPTDD